MSQGISFAGNTFNPCLLILRKNGYRLWIEESESSSMWCADKDEAHFMAYSPPELLGIVTLWETYGEAWNRQLPNILEEISRGE